MFAELGTAFRILLFGWGGIFLVMFVIYITSLLLSRLFPPKAH